MCLSLVFSVPVFAAINPNIVLDGKMLSFDVKPIIEDNRTLTPIRVVSESLGANVSWDNDSKTVTIKKDDLLIKLVVGQATVTINGKSQTLDVASKIVNGRTLVPLRFISESFGFKVDWNNSSKTVILSTSKAVEEPAIEVSNPLKDEDNSNQNNNEQESPNNTESNNTESNNDSKDNNDAKEDLTKALKNVSVEDKGEITQITISSNVQISVADCFTLSNPTRQVIDLNGVRLGAVPEQISFKGDLVSDVRLGQYEENAVRVVADLNLTCFCDYDLSEDRKTLVISLEPKSSEPVMAKGPKVSLADATIVIDPGHGGSESGAIGSTGLDEKDVNLDLALKVKAYLEAKGANVVMTRSTDKYVGLSERPQIANDIDADIFVSIHNNASESRSANGTSTYYIRPDKVYNGDEQLLVESIALAEKLQASLLSGLGLQDRGVLNANFAVLRGSMVPAVLLEVAFISNLEEEQLLMSEDFKNKTALSIVKGIENYFNL